MTTFMCMDLPYLRILQPDGSYTQFHGGRLDIPEDDPRHAAVLAEAIRNPAISIMVNSTTCPYDGLVFTGDTAAAQLDAHKQDIHFELWQKERDLERATILLKEVKARAGFACDICQPVQTFGDAGQLAEHARFVHATPPALDAEGNTVGGGGDDDGGRRPGEVAVPAAKTSTRHGLPGEPSINALRAQAKTLGLSVAGSKAELVQRIASAQ